MRFIDQKMSSDDDAASEGPHPTKEDLMTHNIKQARVIEFGIGGATIKADVIASAPYSRRHDRLARLGFQT